MFAAASCFLLLVARHAIMACACPEFDQRGAALILVIWVIAFMAVLPQFSLIARTESAIAACSPPPRYAAQSPDRRAVVCPGNSGPTRRWVGDEQPYEFG